MYTLLFGYRLNNIENKLNKTGIKYNIFIKQEELEFTDDVRNKQILIPEKNSNNNEWQQNRYRRWNQQSQGSFKANKKKLAKQENKLTN